MTQLSSILKMRLATLRNQAHNLKKDSLAKIFVVVFGLTNVLGIGYWVSYESFKFVESFPAFGIALNGKMVSLLFFALLVLVILSTIIVAYATVFLARETEYLFQHPIPPRTIFFVKLGEAIAFSSWATLFLCLPVLVAFGFIRKAPATYYLESAGILALFLLFSGLAGTSLAILLAPAVRSFTPRKLLALGGCLLLALGWIFLRSFNFWDMDGENNLLILDRFTTELTAMHSPYSPSYWASAAVLAAASGNHQEALFHGSTLLANTLIFVPLLSWYGIRHYGYQWIASRGAPAGKTPAKGGKETAAAKSNPAQERARLRRQRAISRGPMAALISKDILTFVRDPAQLSQSLLFVLLMVIYSLSLVRIPAYLTSGELQLLIYFANLGAVCMILSSFTSRFLFPLMSLEGQSFWIVGLAPVSRSYLVREKVLLGFGISLILGLLTIIISNRLLHSPPELFAGAVFTLLLAGICLTSLATGLGAAYPLFEEDNPARIAVGLGGTLNFFASAIAVAILIVIEAAPYLLAGTKPGPWRHASHLVSLAFTAFLSTLSLRLGSRAMARRDF